jgi:hypothetical protein
MMLSKRLYHAVEKLVHISILWGSTRDLFTRIITVNPVLKGNSI